jgi:hypothetical protein
MSNKTSNPPIFSTPLDANESPELVVQSLHSRGKQMRPTSTQIDAGHLRNNGPAAVDCKTHRQAVFFAGTLCHYVLAFCTVAQ